MKERMGDIMGDIMDDKDIEQFLKKMGMKDDQQPETNQWDRVIAPSSSYLIVGDVGTGKSALAFDLLETYSQKYELTPVVVGFPENKRELLPENFVIADNPDKLTQIENAICFIDEADIQIPIEDTKARKYVINFLSLPRHRNQIFLLAFHFPRLVMGRYLPFFSAFLLKRPPYLLEFASKSKGDALNQMMERAEERFIELPSNDDIVKNTYIVAPRIRWQGMLSNPLCSFWLKELDENGNSMLSRIWAGTEVEKPQKKQKELWETQVDQILAQKLKGWLAIDPEKRIAYRVTEAMERRAQQVEDHMFEGSGYTIMEADGIRWVKQVY